MPIKKVRRGLKKMKKLVPAYKYKRGKKIVRVPAHFRTYYVKVQKKIKNVKVEKFPLLMAIIAGTSTYYGFSRPAYRISTARLSSAIKKEGRNVPVQKVDAHTLKIKLNDQKVAEALMEIFNRHEKWKRLIDFMFVSKGNLYIKFKKSCRVVD